MAKPGKLADRFGDDDATRTAIAVLAAAFAEIKMPGVIGLRVITSALREAARSGSADALEFAGRTFDTIDPDSRGLIARHVEDYARSTVLQDRLKTPQAAPGLVQANLRRSSRSGATGLLSVLNR